MGYRHHIQKQSSQKSAFTPQINPFEPRPFANGVKARSAELPKTDLLQTRPFAPPMQPEPEIPDLQTQREIAEPVGHSLDKIRIHAPSAPPPPPPVQRKEGFGGLSLPLIQRTAPVINWLSLSREEKLGGQETVQEKEVGSEISIQRLCDECKSELADQEDKQSVQAKLTVGEPGDKYEQEADAVARQVVDKINSPQPQQSVQRQSDKEGASELGLTLMRHSEGGFGEGVSVTQDVEQGIQQARGGGQSLDESVRQPMEQAFGADTKTSNTFVIQRQLQPQPGYWNPPGNQPIPFYLGNQAHLGIASFYATNHSGDIVFANFITILTILQEFQRMGLTPKSGALSTKDLGLKPDILNASRRHLYEIKPESSQNLAFTEAQMYARIFAAAGIGITLGPIDEPGTRGLIPAPGGFYIFWSPIPGVIVYRYGRQPVPEPVPAPKSAPAPQPATTSQSNQDFMQRMAELTGLTGTALIIYLIISEGSRLFPPRNLVPVP